MSNLKNLKFNDQSPFWLKRLERKKVFRLHDEELLKSGVISARELSEKNFFLKGVDISHVVRIDGDGNKIRMFE